MNKRITSSQMSWRALLSHNLREIRITFCQSNKSSEGLRNFVVNNYTDLKRLNPKLPLLIREGHGIEPTIYARYDWGEEEKTVVTNLSEQEVEEKLKEICLLGDNQQREPKRFDEFDIVSAYDKNVVPLRPYF
ncbi:hypothetical protein DICPUDRAFT_52529 [Dictyostelium purpureum]|uniref:Ribosomal protein/NADH dehydrogenase domain-containing protein n=1 Tax=Dictyostelium purpureum TaxID=5786 RepID=F0Z8R4_DICPU|nr:uncharacterized protein DICPUDRAFT_52529 [Dictyostelium purpureum]EGC39704.1 hypothetical protein DICPUDRAFT_52529 [Dictyostelium purpureum]|eukprot:XP_003283813.1 hypothetical protein DICPUDRAFT_52529 [Dictyostelium purpureum]